jgi:hypothetical protein
VVSALVLKPYTLYRCPSGEGYGHSSVWTGALLDPARTSTSCCCGEPFVEVVEDGYTYRLEWESMSPWGGADWHPTSKDSTDRTAIVAQWRQLSEWARTGAEPIRNVRLSRAETVWSPFDPDAPEAAA